MAQNPQLIVGFTRSMREVLDRIDFDNTIRKLGEAGRDCPVWLLNFAGSGLPVCAPSRLFYATSATAPWGGVSASRAATR